MRPTGRRSETSRPAFGAVLLAVSLAASCGGDFPALAPVSGTITLNGAPLPNARVVFHQEGARDSYALTDAEGRYELIYLRTTKGATLGEHTVTIVASSAPAAADQILPSRYNAATTLTANVEPGENVHSFDLEQFPSSHAR